MTEETPDEIWDDLFHGCAWAAFVEQATTEGNWPDVTRTRDLAYEYYEDALSRKSTSPPETYQPTDPQ